MDLVELKDNEELWLEFKALAFLMDLVELKVCGPNAYCQRILEMFLMDLVELKV